MSSVTRSARQRAISPASPPSSASSDSAGPAVSMTSTSGSRRPAASAMPRRASRSAAGPTIPPTACAAGRAPRPVDRRTGPAPAPSSRPRPRRCRTAARVRSPRAAAGARRRGGPAGGRPPPNPTRARRASVRPAARSGGCVGHCPATTFSARSRVRRSPSSGTTPSMTPCRCRFSAVCTPGRKRLAVQLLVDPRTQETDQRARLGDRDVAERTPRREHPAGRRMAQVHQIGQVRLLVQCDGGGDLDHLQERDGALLHAGAARNSATPAAAGAAAVARSTAA